MEYLTTFGALPYVPIQVPGPRGYWGLGHISHVMRPDYHVQVSTTHGGCCTRLPVTTILDAGSCGNQDAQLPWQQHMPLPTAVPCSARHVHQTTHRQTPATPAATVDLYRMSTQDLDRL